MGGWNLDNIVVRNMPCQDCERNLEVPKVCRKGCEKWEAFEVLKKVVYEARGQAARNANDYGAVEQDRARRVENDRNYKKKRYRRRIK